MPQDTPCPDSIAARRRDYVAWIAEHFGAMEADMAPADGRRWALNHARLTLGREVPAANGYFTSFGLCKDADIGFIRHLKTFLEPRAAGRLSAPARAHIRGLLTAWPRKDIARVARWPAIHTENHDLMQLTIGLFAEVERGQDIAPQVAALMQFLTWRFERGFIEWNSPCYQFHVSNPLILLADHAPDNRLRQAAGDLLNVMLAERLVLGVNGYLGGPAFRCRTADASNSPTARQVAYLEDSRYDGFLPTVWLAFGLGEPRFDFAKARVPGLNPATIEYASANEPRLKQDEGMFFACSAFQPHHLLMVLAEEARRRPLLAYQGQRFLGWPGAALGETLWSTQRWLPGALHYYNTPHVSMGSIHSDGWICQSRYDRVVFAADPSQGLRVEIILPDVPPHKRRYEARGRVVQHRNWLLGQGTLFEDGGIRARRVGAWNLYRVGKGLCAHGALPDAYHVLQVPDLDQYASEEAFVAALSVPRMAGRQVEAATSDGDRVAVSLEDMAIAVNGVPRPHPPARLHDSECLTAEYGSGRITVRTARGSVSFGTDRP